LNKEVVVEGKVFSGSKRGKHFVNLPWVKKQINAKLGFDPYIGTLNLRVTNEMDTQDLRKANGIRIKPEKGYYEGKCFKALVMKKIEGAVVLPDVPEYPSDILEVLAPVNLRKILGLKDGEMVEVTIKIE
jgi:riboflavin kinase